MKKYLLLRNNKQSGPYTSEELLALGLKSQDLLWVEGKSASWRYPAEFDEFKIHTTILQELPADHTFTNIQNDIFLFRPELAMPLDDFPEDELSEFPTLALFLDPETLKRQGKSQERSTVAETLPPPTVKKEESPRKIRIYFEGKSISDDDSLLKTPEKNAIPEIPIPNEKQENGKTESLPFVPKRISVMLPSAVSDKTLVIIHRKDIERKHSSVTENNPAPVPPIDRLTEKGSTKKELVALPPEPINAKHAREGIPPVEESLPVLKKGPSPKPVQEETRPFVFPVRTSNEASSNLMQKLAVAAGIISIIAVFGLLANAILNPDAYNYLADKKPASTSSANNQSLPASPISEQTSNQVAELPLNTTVQNPKTEDPAAPKSAANKNLVQAKKDKTSDPSVNHVVTTDQTVTEVPGTIVSPKEEKLTPPDPKEETRKNINSLVSYQLKNYKVNAFGGVSDFEVTINNGSSYPLDLVVVEIKYIQSNKKVYKTERLEFRDVAPNGKQTLGVAKTNRGIKVETAITTISSRDLDLSYNN